MTLVEFEQEYAHDPKVMDFVRQYREMHDSLMTVACQDTVEYDNRVCDMVAERLLEVIIRGEEFSSFGGEKLNLLVFLIVGLIRERNALHSMLITREARG